MSYDDGRFVLVSRYITGRHSEPLHAGGGSARPSISDLIMAEIDSVSISALRVPTPRYNVAVVFWEPVDGMAEAVANALGELGHRPLPFAWDGQIPAAAD